jgi:hypothetical protein
VGLRSVNEQAMGRSQDVTKGRRIVAAWQCTRLAAKAGYNNSRDNTLLEVRLEQSCAQRPKGGGPAHGLPVPSPVARDRGSIAFSGAL